MFKRLVSNLPYSPALIGQVGFYAGRLRKEEATRRLGLIFTALALVVQSFAVFNPPEAQAIAHPQNMIFQGVESKADLLRVYDANTDSNGNTDIQELFTYFGIKRSDLVKTKPSTFNSQDFNLGIWSVGRMSYDAGTPHEKKHHIKSTDTTVHARKLWRYDTLPRHIERGTDYRALVGYRADGSWFAVMFDCGNIVYTKMPPPTPKAKPSAACSNIIVTTLSRNTYQLKATANLKNNAKVSGYDFVVKDIDNNIVSEEYVANNTKNANVEITLPGDGEYSAQATVHTSEGKKTGDQCIEFFGNAPEPRCPYKKDLLASHSDCLPCPGDDNLWHKSEKCNPKFIQSKSVSNESQNLKDATTSTAKAGDRMVYTLKVQNVGNNTGEYEIRDNLSDVLEYADIVDIDGASLETNANNNPTGYVSWPSSTIQPNETTVRNVTVEVKQNIPASPRSEGNPESYNCMMTNSFGNATNIMVDCPPSKQVEQVVQQLPDTGARTNITFSIILAMLVAYFWARTRQMKKEVKLLRKEFASGGF